MDELNEREIQTQRSAVAPDGTAIQERTRTVGTATNPKSVLLNIIWYVYGVVAVLLVIRFILKIAGANGNAGFVHFIYAVTGVLSAPFDTIFGVAKASSGDFTSVFEPSILVAIAIYGLIAWGIAKLLNITKPRDTVGN